MGPITPELREATQARPRGLRRLLAAAMAGVGMVTTGAVAGGLRPASVHADASVDSVLFNLINQDRAQNGLPALRWNAQVSAIAESRPYGGCGFAVAGRAQDMIQRNYFSHTICGTQNVFTVMGSAGMPYGSGTENIGWESGKTDPTEAAVYLNQLYMNSPEHRANILNPAVTDVGVGSWSTSPGQTWSGMGSPLGSVTMSVEVFAIISAPPPAAPPPAAATIAVAGMDAQLYVRHPGAGWAPLGGTLSAAPAVVAIPTPIGLVDLYITVGTDGALWERTDFAGWQHLSPGMTTCRDNPAAAVAGSTLVVACQGPDHAIWVGGAMLNGRDSELPAVQGFSNLGGTTSFGPAVAVVDGALTYFALGTDRHLYQRTGASGWGSMGDAICDEHPAAGGAGSVSFVACRGADGALWYAVSSGGGWSGFSSVGGVLTQAPGMAAYPDHVVFTVQGNGGEVYQMIAGAGATGWTPQSGQAQFGAGSANS